MANTVRQVLSKRATVTYKDTAAKNLFTLPANAEVLFFIVDVKTAFNDSGTDLLDIGKQGSAEFFAKDIDVGTATQVFVTQYELGDIGDRVLEVQATYAGGSADATAGSAEVICVYTSKFATRQ